MFDGLGFFVEEYPGCFDNGALRGMLRIIRALGGKTYPQPHTSGVTHIIVKLPSTLPRHYIHPLTRQNYLNPEELASKSTASWTMDELVHNFAGVEGMGTPPFPGRVVVRSEWVEACRKGLFGMDYEHSFGGWEVRGALDPRLITPIKPAPSSPLRHPETRRTRDERPLPVRGRSSSPENRSWRRYFGRRVSPERQFRPAPSLLDRIGWDERSSPDPHRTRASRREEPRGVPSPSQGAVPCETWSPMPRFDLSPRPRTPPPTSTTYRTAAAVIDDARQPTRPPAKTDHVVVEQPEDQDESELGAGKPVTQTQTENPFVVTEPKQPVTLHVAKRQSPMAPPRTAENAPEQNSPSPPRESSPAVASTSVDVAAEDRLSQRDDQSTANTARCSSIESSMRVFETRHGMPLSFHVIGSGSVEGIFRIAIQRLGGGIIAPLEGATYIVLPLSSSQAPNDSAHVALLERIKDQPWHVAVGVDWVEGCLSQKTLLDATPYRLHLGGNQETTMDATRDMRDGMLTPASQVGGCSPFG